MSEKFSAGVPTKKKRKTGKIILIVLLCLLAFLLLIVAAGFFALNYFINDTLDYISYVSEDENEYEWIALSVTVDKLIMIIP